MTIEDEILLEIIMGYCDNISSAVERFSIDGDTVANDPDMRALLAFFAQQIGETSRKLSEQFKADYPEINWRSINGMRNRIVHAYGKVDPRILWDTIQSDIPELRDFCAGQLEKK